MEMFFMFSLLLFLPQLLHSRMFAKYSLFQPLARMADRCCRPGQEYEEFGCVKEAVVKAVEGHSANSLVVEGSDGFRRTVTRIPADMSGVEIFQDGVEFRDIQDEEDGAEEATDELLHELEMLEYEVDI